MTTSGAITSDSGDVTLTTLSPDDNARALTVNGNITAYDGSIDLEAANITSSGDIEWYGDAIDGSTVC